MLPFTLTRSGTRARANAPRPRRTPRTLDLRSRRANENMKDVMTRPQGPLVSRAPRLGVFVDGLVDGYQAAVVAGAYEGTELGAHLVCFVGGILGSPLRFATERNQIYQLASKDNIDALILVSGAIGNQIGKSELVRFAKR